MAYLSEMAGFGKAHFSGARVRLVREGLHSELE